MTTQIGKLTGNAKQFAEACYDMNSIDELKECLSGPADETDCKNWSISAEEWKMAIKAALSDRLNND